MTKIKANLIANLSMCACDVMQYGGVGLLASVSLFCLVIFGLFKLIKS